MVKTVQIGGVDVPLKCTAATPGEYRILFGTDIFKDIVKFQAFQGPGGVQLDEVGDVLETVNQVAYVMAKQADESIAPYNEWLDQFGMTDIMGAVGEIIQLWGMNMETNAKSKKKPAE